MKNKILSMGLFKEGVRQLRAIGIAFSCISALVMLFKSINFIEHAMHYTKLTLTFSPGTGSMQVAAAIGIYVVLPVMSLMIFNFLNSRSACDFYHSMPKTRIQLALSFGLSVAFWLFVPILAVTATETLFALIFWDIVDFASIGMFLLNTFSMFLHIYGILLLSVSLATGILNQIAAAGIIAFLPRVMMLIMGQISENAAPVLIGMTDNLGEFGEIYFNLLFENGVLTGNIVFENTVIAKNLYSIALGLIYGTLGVVCFCRRKSEAATVSGANKYVQCAIRVLVAFVICLIPCYMLGSSIMGSESNWEILENLVGDLPTLLLCYGFALVAYFLYEAITAKKIRGVITFKGTMGIGLLALAVLNVLFIAVPVVSADIALATDINKNNVESVSLYSYDGSYGVEYNEIGLSEVEFEDAKVVSALCKALQKDIDEIESGTFYDYIYRENMTSVKISFNMKDGRVLNRRVYLPQVEYSNIYEAMCNDKDYVAMQRRMPTVAEVESCYTSTALTSEQAIKLYEILRNELSKMSDEDYLLYISSSEYSDYDKYNEYENTSIGNISLEGRKGKNVWNSSYAVNTLVPETYQLCIDMCNENNDFEDISFAEYFKKSDETHINVKLMNYRDENGELLELETWSVGFTEETPSNNSIEIIEAIDKYWNEPVDASKAFYMIDYFIDDYDYEGDSEYTWVSGVYFVPAEELIEETGYFIGS